MIYDMIYDMVHDISRLISIKKFLKDNYFLIMQ